MNTSGRLFVLWALASVPLIGGCAIAMAQGSPLTSDQCFTQAGNLSDTLYFERRLHDAAPPVPRRPHLAPYPPAAGGEYSIRFREELYIAAGMPILVSTKAGSEYKFVRIGSAGEIPVYIQDGQGTQSQRLPRIWAPITETCVFLPFNHESEIR